MSAAPQASKEHSASKSGSRRFCFLNVVLLILAGASAAWSAHHEGTYGVLVMAHGGTEEWDQAVLDAVEPLREKYPVEVAFGMADASTIDEGVKKLESSNASRIGVVRLFVSGESWYERTEQILGLIEGAPSANEWQAEAESHGEHDGHPDRGADKAHHDMNQHPGHASEAEEVIEDSHTRHGTNGDQDQGGHHMAPFYRIETTASFTLSTEGLAQAPEMDEVLLLRASTLSESPESEDVLLLAHGPGDDGEDERWIATINDRADLLRREVPFRRVEVMTLREDWPEKREAAEERVREFVRRANEEGGQAIVIPYRVFGFGPYAEILEGLDYTSDGQGLIPHEAVTQWIDKQASSLQTDTFRLPID